MKNRFAEIILHSIFWTATAWLLTNSFSVQMRQMRIVNGVETLHVVRNAGLMWQILKCIAVGAVVFYTTAWLFLRNNEFKKQAILWLILIFGAGILLVSLLTILDVKALHPPLPPPIAFGIVTFYFTVSIAYSIAKLFYRNHERQQQLLLDKKQTELTLLRNQLQPHFLFNALNNLLSMVKPNENPKLVDSFERLSQLLRYVIEETQSEKVSINKEIAFLENYIELQKLRFNDNEVLVNFNVTGEYFDQKIEPGLYITFVENAFKYGTEPEQTSKIEIDFDLTQEYFILFTIKNKVMLTNLTGSKTGIETTRRRLALIYPDKHHLQIEQTENFVVSLNIQTQ
jgi:sensor histidine kinase YesM